MNITLENLYDAHRNCLLAVYSENYYVDIFERVVPKHLTDNSETPLTPQEICSLWNKFWFAIPDSRSCRRDPFFLICDLAEGAYLEPEYDDGND